MRLQTAALLSLLLLGTVTMPARAGEKSGPNPGNLAPSGSQSVSLFTGAFTYTCPIAVPPGRKGIQPDIRIVYNSQASNGWLGTGWDLSVGSIQRSTKKGIPSYNDDQDIFIFSLSGQTSELVPVNPTSANPDAVGPYNEYRAQIESGFIRFRYYPSVTGKPWVAWTKDGKRYNFQGLAQNNANGQFFYWGLSTLTDPNGNTMQISYPSVASPAGAPAIGGGAGAPHASAGSGGVTTYIPSSISYGANKLEFTIEARPDPLTSYQVGFQQQIQTRLKSIQVFTDGNLVRNYDLGYTSGSNSASLLQNLKESVPNNAEVHTTTFGYQDGHGLDFTQTNPATLSQTSYGNVSVGDFNGDGFSDLYYYPYQGNPLNGHNHYIGISNGDGAISYGVWSSNLVDKAVAVDYNNDGKSDSLGYYSTLAGGPYNDSVGLSNSSSLIYSPWNTLTSGSRYLVGVGDIDGDGLPDNIFMEHSGLAVDFNKGNTFNHANWDANIPSNISCGDAWAYPNNCVFRTGDFNGDGKIDLFLYDANTGNSWVSISNGSPFAFSSWTNQKFGDGSTPILSGDFNGDGLTDVAYYQNGVIFVGLSTGHSFAVTPWASVTDNTSRKQTLRAVDINGDGLPDLIFLDGSQTWVGINTGSSFTFSQEADNPGFPAGAAEASLLAGDFNGDGKGDVAVVDSSLQTWLGISKGPAINLLNHIQNPLGGVIDITYKAYNEGNTNALPFPVQVVKSVTVSDGLGSSVASAYEFSGGLYQKLPWINREFLGFKKVIIRDPENNYSVTHFLQNDSAVNGINLFKGRISEQESYDSSGSLLAKTVNTYSYVTPFAGVYFPFQSQVDSYIDSKHSEIQYQYDCTQGPTACFGNMTQELNLGDADLTGDERTVTTDYSANAVDYLVSYPVHKKVLKSDGSVASENWFTYDDGPNFMQPPVQGLLTKSESLLSGGSNVIAAMAYDDYGNLTDNYDALWIASDGAQGNHVQTTYESTYHQFPLSITRAVGSLNLTESYTFDPVTGQMLSHTDANSQMTRYQYDAFGRLIAVVNPNDSLLLPTASYQYNINASPPHLMVSSARVVSGSSLTLSTYAFFDGTGRKRETKAPGPNTTQIVSDVVTLDSRGLVSKAYLPYTAALASDSYISEDASKPVMTTQYDAMGRVTNITAPDGKITSTSYQDWSNTVTDSNGHSKDYMKNAYGQIVQVNEHNQGQIYLTFYQYDVLGNLLKITNSQNQDTLFTYDTLSRKTSINDPQIGNWQYQYDANSNLIRQTDAKNQTIQLDYDALNRLTTKAYPDGTSVTYQYDTGDFAKGHLSQVTDLSGTQAFTYDNLGRITQKARTIGSSVYNTQMTYDNLGRETSVTYPNNSSVQNNYDGGVLNSVQDGQDGTVYAALSYDDLAVGKLKAITYGNGITASYSYQPDNFYISTLGSKNSSGQVLQSFGYAYDNVGNISRISDAVSGSAQTYLYDDLNRLIQANGTYGEKDYAYDSLGNISTNAENLDATWGFDSTDDVVMQQGTAYISGGRLGNGIYFDGTAVAKLARSNQINPGQAITAELWVRPLELGTTGYIFAKPNTFSFPQLNADGSLDAQLSLSSGQQVIHISSAVRFNIWSHLVMTYDGKSIKIYVNGQLQGQTAASGIILGDSSAMRAGNGFKGILDEINVYPRALSAQEVLLRYQSVPNMPPNQPLAPAPTQDGQVSAPLNVAAGFKFAAWALEGDPMKYRIDWGTGTVMDTGYVPSGSVVIASHSWSQPGTYSIRVQAVELPAGTTTEIVSAWSPVFNIAIAQTVSARWSGLPLIGAKAGVSQSTQTNIQSTIGEWLVSKSTSPRYQISFGYQGQISDTSPWWAVSLGAQGEGGADATPPSKMPVTSFLYLGGTTAQEQNQIALGLRQNGYVKTTDNNGNYRLSGRRWIKWDVENRPIEIITADGTVTQFVYDFEGSRVKKTVIQGDTTQTSLYIGQIYEVTDTHTIQYISAGPLRVAMKTSDGDVLYFLPDHLGSTSIMTDVNQVQVRSDQYTPFGSLYSTSGSKDSDYKFTGQRLDDTTGLYYYGARYYDPELETFISPDSIVQNPYDPQTLNRYVYVRNNPIRLVDPSGHAWNWFERNFSHPVRQWADGINAAINGLCSGNVHCNDGGTPRGAEGSTRFDGGGLDGSNGNGSVNYGGSGGGNTSNLQEPQPNLLGGPQGPLDVYRSPWTTPDVQLVSAGIPDTGEDRYQSFSNPSFFKNLGDVSSDSSLAINIVGTGFLFGGPPGLAISASLAAPATVLDLIAAGSYGVHYGLTQDQESLHKAEVSFVSALIALPTLNAGSLALKGATESEMVIPLVVNKWQYLSVNANAFRESAAGLLAGYADKQISQE